MNQSWTSGRIKPTRNGIYTRNNFGDTRKSKWDGKNWLDSFFKYPTDKKVWMKAYNQNLEWRENE